MTERTKCVVCGQKTDPTEPVTLCGPCNTHGPGGCGWAAATQRDLRGIPVRSRERVARLLGIVRE